MKPLNKKNIQDILALTPMQEGMLFHYLQAPASGGYFEQLSLEISGEIDTRLFEKAWNFVIETNEMLRAVFRWEEVDNPLQIILKELRLRPGYYDFASMEASEKKKHVEEIKTGDRKEKFDLREVPFRVTLCKIAEKKHVLIISNHHILYDGWSNGIILEEFFNAYNNLANGAELVKPVKQKFKEFIKWNQNCNLDNQEEFWETYLKGMDTAAGSSIRIKRQQKRNKIENTGHYHRKFPGQVKDRINIFVKKNKVSLPSLLYCAWGVLLQKYNSSNDVLFDVTVSGRSPKIKGIEDIIGLFINTLPMRVQTHGDERITEVLTRISGTVQRLGEFENRFSVNLRELIDEYNNETFFDSVVVIENYPLASRLIRGGELLTIDSFSISGMTAYDMTIIMTIFDDICLDFSYNQALFNEETTTVVSDHLISIIDEITINPRQHVSRVGKSIEKEMDTILYRLRKNREAGFNTRDEYAAARNEVEKKLVEIWSNLLHIEKSAIGIDANFFEFGGHSLKAVVLVSKLNKEFKVKVPLTEVFKRATIRELSRYIREFNDKAGKFSVIEPVEKKEYYPLSSAQKRIFTIQQMDLNSIAYNGPCVMAIEGDLDNRRLEKVFWELIRRHESIRTSFAWVEDKPVQKIHEKGELDIEYHRTDEKDAEEILSNAVMPFNLEKLPLIRVRCLNLDPQRRILFVDMHHIITDGASMEILINELIMLYEGKELSRLTLQYKDYSRWQNSKREIERIKKQETFWLEQFKGEIPLLNLPSELSRSGTRSSGGSMINFEIGKKETRRLKKIVVEKGITLYMLLLAVYSILLSKYTGQQDIVIGAVTSGRTHEALQDIIGMFTNFLAMRTYPKGNKIFNDFLAEIKHNTLDVFENQDYQYEELIKRLKLQKEPGRDPLIDAAFTVQNMDMDEVTSETTRKNAPFNIRPVEFDPGITKWALDLFATEYRETIGMTLVYSTDLFRESTAGMITEHFINILEQVLDNETIPLKDIKIYHDLAHLKSKTLKDDGGDFIF